MARGDGGKTVFETNADRKAFLFRLGQVCGSHGWKVHAWVLMGNHFHLLLETPEPNLVSGMRLLMGSFAQGWNRARMRRGHVFQGRYKSVPVKADEGDPYYFRIVADYIHLNPARASLAGGSHSKLTSYKWSSVKAYETGKGPDWLVTDRVMRAFELAEDGRGRRAYIRWLEARASNDGGKVDKKAMSALRRGWYLGEPSFADKLRKLVDGSRVRKVRGRDRAAKAHDEAAAKELASQALEAVGLPVRTKELSELRKGDPRKILVALLLRKHTSVNNQWLSECLVMGHPAGVSRLVSSSRKQLKSRRKVSTLEEMLKCNT